MMKFKNTTHKETLPLPCHSIARVFSVIIKRQKISANFDSFQKSKNLCNEWECYFIPLTSICLFIKYLFIKKYLISYQVYVSLFRICLFIEYLFI